MDMLLAQTGLATKCLLNYGITKKDLCPNCIYDPSLKKSANKYKIGGPKPFVDGRICPYCNGAGYNGIVKVDEIYLAVIWDYKYWINKPINIQNPTGFIQTICDRSLLDKIKKAKDLTVVYTTNNSNPLFKLSEEPNPNGLGDNNYLICNWERTGISSITESMVPRPIVGFNSVNYLGPLGNIMLDVGTNGGPSSYGTYDQNGNAEEWTGTKDGNSLPLRIKVGGGYAGSDASSLLKGGIYGASESGTRYRGFRIATLSNPNDYNNFVLVDDRYNKPDSNGYGSVSYDYYIGKYEITYDEWCDFANSVASYTTSSGLLTSIDRDINDPGELWGNPEITSDTYALLNNSFWSRIDYVEPSGFPGNYTYTAKDEFKNKPVTNISWLNSLRYCNWLHNSKPSGYQTLNNDGSTPNVNTTEDGAYTLNGLMTLTNFISPQSSAKYRLPTIHEWYKAGFYKSISNNASTSCSMNNYGYWNYATQNDTLPSVSNTGTTDDIALQLVYDTTLDPTLSGTIVLPLSNPLDIVVDWGDGTIESFIDDGQASHTYQSDNEYTVRVVGNLQHMNNKLAFSRSGPSIINSHQNSLKECKSFGNIGLDSLYRFFYGCSELVSVPESIPESITSLQEAFTYCTSFNVDSQGSGVMSWDTSNITNMQETFRFAVLFNQDISSWDVSNVTNFAGMFRDALDFNQNINDWDITSANTLSAMFYNTSFDSGLSNWNLASVTDISLMFAFSDFNQYLNDWNVSNVVNMYYLFGGNNTFNQSLSLWNVSSVQNMSYVFSGASAFNRSIDSWDVSSVTDMRFMFAGAYDFDQPLNSWDVSNVTNMDGMFKNSDLTTGFNRALNNWDVSSVTSMIGMFSNNRVFNQDLSSWCVTNISTKPTDFDNGAIAWVLARPVWGTCP